MKKRKLSRRFGFEKLEGRRLLAADFCMQAMPEVETTEPVHCEVASFECPANDPVADPATESNPVEETQTATDPDPRILDLTDGMDGYFGAINAENPAESLEFTAPGDGMVDIVLASSFGNAQASLSVTNSQGEVIETQAEGLEGFDVLTFEVEEGETYKLSISSDDANCEGNFQLTAGFSAHVDQHADAIGSESTELELVENQADLSGRLESAGDIDTFRFTATSNGEMTLEMHETVDDARVGLGVSIQDADGNILAQGATNEMLQISFDVSEGQEYYISLAAGDGQTGTYDIGLNLTPSLELPASEIVDSQVNDLDTDPYVTLPETCDPETSEPELVDGQTTENQDADPATGDPSDMEVISDLDEPDVDPVSELVDSNDETEGTDAADLVVEPVLVDDCQLGETEGDVSEAVITNEPIEIEPTDAIATDPVDQQPADPETESELVESELVDSTEEQLEEVLAAAWDTCNAAEPIDIGDNSSSDLVTNPELEPVADDLISDTSADATESETEIDQPLVSFDDQDVVDDFFAELGNEFELHFDLSFGHGNFETAFSLV